MYGWTPCIRCCSSSSTSSLIFISLAEVLPADVAVITHKPQLKKNELSKIDSTNVFEFVMHISQLFSME